MESDDRQEMNDRFLQMIYPTDLDSFYNPSGWVNAPSVLMKASECR